jgi:hypothetical protein
LGVTLWLLMKILVLSVLLTVGVAARAGTLEEDMNVLVMDSQDGGLWRAFESNKTCLGLRAVRLFDRSDSALLRWGLAVVGNGHGNYEVLLIERPTKHNIFFGTNIRKGVGRACKVIQEAIRVSHPTWSGNYNFRAMNTPILAARPALAREPASPFLP